MKKIILLPLKIMVFKNIIFYKPKHPIILINPSLKVIFHQLFNKALIIKDKKLKSYD
jgi:hypothetical protein